MAKLIKASVFDVNMSNPNIFSNGCTLENILKDLSSRLDTEDLKESRIFDISGDKETSIWFDSFDDIENFSKEEIFDNTICFLLAKDMSYQFVENKEKNQIESARYNKSIRPKIPAHCIYLKDENILLMEETQQTPTIASLKKGIIRHTYSSFALTNNNIEFKPKYRKDIIERLNQFMDKIETIELIDLNIEQYLKETKNLNGYIQNLLLNPKTKLKAVLQLDSDDWRIQTVDFFTKAFHKIIPINMQDIKIKYKDNKEQKDIVALYENLVQLKIEKDWYLEDISNLNELDRLEYSKEVYRIIINEYRNQRDN